MSVHYSTNALFACLCNSIQPISCDSMIVIPQNGEQQNGHNSNPECPPAPHQRTHKPLQVSNEASMRRRDQDRNTEDEVTSHRPVGTKDILYRLHEGSFARLQLIRKTIKAVRMATTENASAARAPSMISGSTLFRGRTCALTARKRPGLQASSEYH